MKKNLMIILVLTLLFCIILASCGDRNNVSGKESEGNESESTHQEQDQPGSEGTPEIQVNPTPVVEVPCELQNGKLRMYINGIDEGIFLFAGNNNDGWTIQNDEGQYINFDWNKKEIVCSAEPLRWIFSVITLENDIQFSSLMTENKSTMGIAVIGNGMQYTENPQVTTFTKWDIPKGSMVSVVCGGIIKYHTSLQDALNNVKEARLTLLEDVTENITINEGQNIVLDLAGHVLKSATEEVSVIKNAGTLTITDSVPTTTHENGDQPCGGLVTGGFAEYGGGITNIGNLTINGGTIYGNKASGGAGIYSEGTLTMNGGAITNNTEALGGGGVYIKTGTFSMTGGEISFNESNKGGGIWSLGTVTLSDGLIQNNSAIMGGGICCEGTLEINGGIIQNNSASVFGGGVYGSGDIVKITDGKITNNMALFGGGVSGTCDIIMTGGSISYNNKSDDPENVFASCGIGGGGLYVNPENDRSLNILISGGEIIGNISAAGGAIGFFVDEEDTHGEINATISGSVLISENLTIGRGGGIFAESDYAGKIYLTMSGGQISKNVAVSEAAGVALVCKERNGACQSKTVFTMTGGLICDNIGSGDGGGVNNGKNADFIMNGGKISGNMALQGSGVYNLGNLTLSGASVISGNTVGGEKKDNLCLVKGCPLVIIGMQGLSEDADIGVNSTTDIIVGRSCAVIVNGGAYVGCFHSDDDEFQLDAINGVITLKKPSDIITEDAPSNAVAAVTVNGNSKFYESFGEAWKAANNITSKVVTVTLFDNVTAQNGKFGEYGSLTVNARSKELALDLNGFTIDRGLSGAITSGEVFCLKGSFSLTIKNGTVTGGNTTYDGGAFWIDGEGIKLTLENLTVKGNQAAGDGGGLYIKAAEKITLLNSIIENNSSNHHGGGICTTDAKSTLELIDVLITDNKAKYNGGGMYLYGNKGSVTLSNVAVMDNTANLAGGVHWDGASNDGNCMTKLTLSRIVFIMDNIANGGVNLWISKASNGADRLMLSEFSQDSEIRLSFESNKTDIFTGNLGDKAESLKDCFIADLDNQTVAVSDGVLKLVAK